MLKYVHQPKLIRLEYPLDEAALRPSPALKSLQDVYETLDIEQDPFVLKLRSEATGQDSKALMKALRTQKTLVNCACKCQMVLSVSSDLHDAGLPDHRSRASVRKRLSFVVSWGSQLQIIISSNALKSYEAHHSRICPHLMA